MLRSFPRAWQGWQKTAQALSWRSLSVFNRPLFLVPDEGCDVVITKFFKACPVFEIHQAPPTPKYPYINRLVEFQLQNVGNHIGISIQPIHEEWASQVISSDYSPNIQFLAKFWLLLSPNGSPLLKQQILFPFRCSLSRIEFRMQVYFLMFFQINKSITLRRKTNLNSHVFIRKQT